MVLEVCVDSLISARAAVAGGADRLELCGVLAVGGVTPYKELLVKIRQESQIPIRCLMRPRPGDFLYTKEELEQMGEQMQELYAAGADGFAIGALRPDGSLDSAAVAQLMECCPGAGYTLHRCIDVSSDLAQTYLAARDLGIDTVLTSGGSANCIEGMEAIKELLALRDKTGGPEVLIGAGVSAGVIRAFRREVPSCRAFHMSGKENRESGMNFRKEGIPMGAPGFSEWHIAYTDEHAVRAAKNELK